VSEGFRQQKKSRLFDGTLVVQGSKIDDLIDLCSDEHAVFLLGLDRIVRNQPGRGAKVSPSRFGQLGSLWRGLASKSNLARVAADVQHDRLGLGVHRGSAGQAKLHNTKFERSEEQWHKVQASRR
jgi:hypothetical protein